MLTVLEVRLPEAERIYRDQLKLLQEKVGPIQVANFGILKARLLRASSPHTAFGLRWLKRIKDRARFVDTLLNRCTGGLGDGAVRDLLLPFARNWLSNASELIMNELGEGPSQLGLGKPKAADVRAASHFTPGFYGLVELGHETLRDSVGDERYTNEIKDSQDLLIIGNLFSSLNEMSQLMAAMK
jgi:hypothetical protein